MLDEADAWISYQKHFPAKDGQFGWRKLQTENMVEGEKVSGSIQMMKSVLKKLKLQMFLAAHPEKTDSKSITDHDQMNSTILTVDWALRPSGVERHYIDFGTITERYRPNPRQAGPERRDQGAIVRRIRRAVGKCQLRRKNAWNQCSSMNEIVGQDWQTREVLRELRLSLGWLNEY
jgi:hypothetical protein